MNNLYIHAGFPKCASTSIQRVLSLNSGELALNRVAVLGNSFEYGGKHTSFPLRYLEALKKEKKNVTPLLVEKINNRSQSNYDSFVLSSENLNNEGFPDLFHGVDKEFNVTIIFYIRAQHLWLASAWKQFEISKGKRLDVFIKQALKSGYPKFKKQISRWKNFCPEAKVLVKPIHPKYLFGGRPEIDFLNTIGCSGLSFDRAERANQSFDYSILHSLMINSHLLSNKKIASAYNKLERKLPEEYKKTNIDLVRNGEKEQISDYFKEENERIICEDMNVVGNVQTVYNDIFEPLYSSEPSYMDLDERVINRRALYILNKALGGEYDDCEVLLSKLLA